MLTVLTVGLGLGIVPKITEHFSVGAGWGNAFGAIVILFGAAIITGAVRRMKNHRG